MKSAILRFAFVASMLAVASPSQAALLLQFSDDNGTSFADDFSVNTGDTITLEVYLTDSDVAGVLNTDGLVGFALVGNWNAGFGTLTSNTINPTFDFAFNDSTATMIEWDAGTIGAAPTGLQVLLGEFEFTTSADGVTTFDFNDRDQGTGSLAANWLSGSNATIDELIFGTPSTQTFSLTVTASAVAVPEPSSIAFLGILACGTVFRRAKR